MNSSVKQQVIDIVNGRDPSETKELVAIEHNQVLVTLPDGVAQMDMQERVQRYAFGLTAGTLTVNEVRESEGLPPIEDGRREKPFIRFITTIDNRIMPAEAESLVPFIERSGLSELPKIVANVI